MKLNKIYSKEHLEHTKIQLWVIGILIFLSIISYGYFWTRGGYADDFVFLNYSNSQSYLDAVQHWSSSFNSRISQGVVIPLLMKVLKGPRPEGFHWEVFHVIGIIAFILTILLLHEILKIFNIPWRVRLIACIFFALNPVKNEAVLWPCTIAGYVLPFLTFLIASYIYFGRAKHGLETMTSLIIVLLLFLFSMLSIEQLVPLFILVIFIRLLVFKTTQKEIVSNVLGIVLLIAVFILVTFSGGTAQRIERFPNVGVASLPSHIINTLSDSLAELSSYPFRILLDQYYWSELKSAFIGLDFLLAIVLLVFLLLILRSFSSRNSELHFPARMSWGLFIVGLAIWIATLSPFMFISYYLPHRVLYLPLSGFSLMVAVVFEFMFQNVRKRWQKTALTAGLTGALGIFVLINIYSQNDFEKKWRIEQQIITSLSKISEEVPPKAEINLLNLPVSYGPSPSFQDNFTFDGIVKWIFPGKNVSGNTQKSFSEIFSIPIDLNSTPFVELLPPVNNKVFIWSNDHLFHIKKILLAQGQHPMSEFDPIINEDSNSKKISQSVDLKANVIPVDMYARYYDGYKVTLEGVIFIEQFDIGLLRFSVNGDNIKDNLIRLVIKANYNNGLSLPYIQNITTRTDFQLYERLYRKYISIPDFSKLKSIKVSLMKKSGKNPKPMDTEKIIPIQLNSTDLKKSLGILNIQL